MCTEMPHWQNILWSLHRYFKHVFILGGFTLRNALFLGNTLVTITQLHIHIWKLLSKTSFSPDGWGETALLQCNKEGTSSTFHFLHTYLSCWSGFWTSDPSSHKLASLTFKPPLHNQKTIIRERQQTQTANSRKSCLSFKLRQQTIQSPLAHQISLMFGCTVYDRSGLSSSPETK